jgi:hypothetical protein
MISIETKTRLLDAYTQNNAFNKEDFLNDVNRIVSIAKIIDKWLKNGDCNYRLLLNHLIIIHNVFGDTGLFALYEYIEEHKECIPSIYATLYFLNKINKPAIYDTDLYQKFLELK